MYDSFGKLVQSMIDSAENETHEARAREVRSASGYARFIHYVWVGLIVGGVLFASAVIPFIVWR